MKTKSVLGFAMICAVGWLLLPFPLAAATPADLSYAQQIQSQRVFATPIVWLGAQEPPAIESQALLAALHTYAGSDAQAGEAALENFLAAHPDSVWAPSLHLNLAEQLNRRGRHTEALAHWAAAWNAAKHDPSPKGQALAARVFARWTSCLLALGQTENLATLFQELKDLQLPLGPFAPKVNETQVYFNRTVAHPEVFFKCGVRALVKLADLQQLDLQTRRQLLLNPAPALGFSLSQLASLANTNGLAMTAVRRPAGADITVPCVAHLRVGHYVTILKKTGNGYQVFDSVAGGEIQMDRSALESESSGAFLLPTDQVPAGWRRISESEGANIRGRGGFGAFGDDDDSPDDCPPSGQDDQDANCDPPAANDGASGGGSSNNPCCDGMAVWRVSEPYINLWLEDAPLFYHLSNGKMMRFKLSYKSRGADDKMTTYGPSVCGFGPNWECNWIGMMESTTPTTGLPGTFINHMAGGGIRMCATASDGSSAGTCDYKTGDQVSVASGVNASAEGGNGGSAASVPVKTSPTGSQSRYAYGASIGSGGSAIQYNLLTRRVDRYGRFTQFNYQTTAAGIVQMTGVTDQDGRTCTLAYSNPAFPNLITSVTGPYNQTAYFNYDSSGRLTNIVDMAGFSSTFQYDGATYVITNLQTGYGNTGFQSLFETDSYSNPCRFLLVTEASQDHQLYAYRDCFTTPTSSGDPAVWGNNPTPVDGNVIYQNSFHWNRKQYATVLANNPAAFYNGLQLYDNNILALTTADYLNASIKHWKVNESYAFDPNIIIIPNGADQNKIVSDTLDSEAGPVAVASPGNRVGPVRYAYMYQTADGTPLNLKRMAGIWINGGLNNNPNVAYTRNSFGRPVVSTYYNSDGTAANYTNNYDPSGTLLRQETGPRGELVRGYGYSNPNFPNLLTSVTNAVGDVMYYTHDAASPATTATFPTIKVTSITFPGGMVRTNIYLPAGNPNQGFLQMQADIGIRTNYFTYVNGNVALQTNELGLVTTNIWDGLNRLISIGFPDGTTVSNLYALVAVNKLDLLGVKDRLNQWAYYDYNSVRQEVVETNVNGQVTYYGYCGCGSLDEVTRWLGNRAINTTINYDIAGRLTSVLYPDNYQINRTYDDNNQLLTGSDSSGRTLQLAYAQHGTKFDLQTASMLSQGASYQILAQIFDEYGRVTNSVDRNAVTVTNSYDFLSRLVARQSFGNSLARESGLETFQYNALGLTNYFDPLQHRTTYVRDVASRILYETNANQEVQQFIYNPSDELVALADGKLQITHWNYDAYGRVTNKVDNTGGEMCHYTYDADDRLTKRLQASTVTTIYGYDPIGNLTNVFYPGSGLVKAYQYDGLNRLTTMVDSIGTNVFSWTDGNQLAGETGPWASAAISYTYANRLRSTLSLLQPGGSAWLQTYQYDDFMRLQGVVSPAGTFGYQYVPLQTPAGINTAPDLLQQLTYPNNSTSLRSYDDLGRLIWSKLTDVSGQMVFDLHGYQYDLGSQRTIQTNSAAGNHVNYNYDNIGQLKTANGYEAGGTARAQEQFGYGYDAAWNLSQRTSGALVQSFGVNSVNELSTASRAANATITVAGSFENGNAPVSVAVAGTGLASGAATVYKDNTWAISGATPANGTSTYTANATDNSGHVASANVTVNLPVSVTYTYDARGNLTGDGWRNFAYDDENELTNVYVANAWRCDFLYDGLLRRRIERDYAWQASAWVQTNEVHYVYDVYLPIQERNGNNVPRVTYTRGNDMGGSLQNAGGIGGLLARTDMTFNSPLSSTYYHADGNGNVTCLIDSNDVVQASYSYDPYGNMLAMSGALADANIYRFSSKEWNNNAGLYYYLYRCYDPNLQRWVNRDPIGEEGGINLYGFSDNDPIDLIDSWGLCPPDGDNNNQNPAASVAGEVLADKAAKQAPPAVQNLKKAASVASAWNDANNIANAGLAKRAALNNNINTNNDPFALADIYDHSNTNGIGGLTTAGLDAGSAAAKASVKTAAVCSSPFNNALKWVNRADKLFPSFNQPSPPNPNPNHPPLYQGPGGPLDLYSGNNPPPGYTPAH